MSRFYGTSKKSWDDFHKWEETVMGGFDVAVADRATGKIVSRVTAMDGTEIETAALYLESEYRSLLSGDPPSHMLTITRLDADKQRRAQQ